MRTIVAGVRLSCFAVVALVFMAASARAATIYTTTGDGTSLGTIDSVTGAGTVIGPFGHVLCYSLAIDVDVANTIYVACAGNLYTANPTTGALTLVGAMVPAPHYGLEIDNSGQLWAAANNSLYKVDKTNGTTTLVGAMGAGVNVPMDLAFSPSGTLYIADGSDKLYTVNTTTGAATLVGGLSVAFIMGLMFDSGGTLFGVTYANPGSLYTINTTTAVATLVGGTGLNRPHNGSFVPAATPVPTLSQWAMIVMATLLVLIGVVAIRRQAPAAQAG